MLPSSCRLVFRQKRQADDINGCHSFSVSEVLFFCSLGEFSISCAASRWLSGATYGFIHYHHQPSTHAPIKEKFL